jgi:parallel beta-helix repeat protein
MTMRERFLFILAALLLALAGTLALLLSLDGGGHLAVHAQGPDGHDTYFVAPGGDCGGMEPCFSNVQAAVDAADDPGDVIKVAAGTYTGVQGRPAPPGYPDPLASGLITQVVYVSKTVTIRGGYTTANWTTSYPITQTTTLNAQEQGRVLFIAGAPAPDAGISPTVEGLRITGGSAYWLGGGIDEWPVGGGVYIINATAAISNCWLFSNTAHSGGGLYLYDSDATLSDNTVTTNTAYTGGGLFLRYSDATLSGNTVSSNTADQDGGGLHLESSDATLNSNTVSSNTAYNGGGGLYLWGSAATLDGNTVTANSAGYGSGLLLRNSAATLDGNTVTANSGGGLHLESSDATLSNNTVSSNTSSGGLYLWDSAAVLNGNIVTANSADSGGGGLYLERSNDATLNGNTVAANTASYGGGLLLRNSDATLSGNTVAANSGGGLHLESSAATLSNNTVSSNTGSGGLYLWDSAAVLNGNIVTANSADSGGGGLYLDISDATLSGNTVFSNTATYDGGGLRLTDSDARLTGNTISSNTAGWGGGLYLWDSDATLINNVVADNRVDSAGSGLYISGSSPRLLHTTIARNNGGDGSGIHIAGNASAVALTNTILVSHTVGITVAAGNAATLEATLWGSGPWANVTDWGGAGTVVTGTVNIWGDPVFRSPETGDYHIGLTSAAVDAGVNAGVTTDIDGEPRPCRLGYDIGADELSCVYLSVVLKNHRTWDAYYEDNDQCSAAYGPLVSSQIYRAYPDDANDYYYFELSAPATVNVSVTDFAPTSTWGELLLYGPTTGDECGGLIGQWGKPGYSSMSLGPYPLGAGKYHVRIYTAKNHSITQLYSLIVTY